MNYLQHYADSELRELLWIAEETHDGRYIKAIKEEMNRRIREE